MILSLHEQARMFLLCIALGGGMGLLYDCLRVFRHSLHKHQRTQVMVVQAILGTGGGRAFLADRCFFGVRGSSACQFGRGAFFFAVRAVRRHGAVFSDAQPLGRRRQRQRDTAYQVSGAPFFSYPFYAVPPAFPPFSETSAEIWRLLRKLAKKTVAKRAGLCENE